MLFEKIELEPNEIVLKVVRKHWFIIVSQLLGTFFFSLLPLFIIVILVLIPDLLPTTFDLGEHLPYIVYALSGWLLLFTLSGFMTWTDYHLDVWIITDRRIIVVDQIAFFNRKVNSFRLERLQDIKVTINGVIATFLDFGTINAQNAGNEGGGFLTVGLPDPRGLQSIIQKAMDARLQVVHGGDK